MDTIWFLCGHHMVSMWLIFHHFYIISVANRSQKIANLWKPVTSLIMVQFSIRKKFWKALGLLYQTVVSISQISWDFGMKQDVREIWASGHHELSRTSRFMLKSHENWLMDTMNSPAHLVSCWNLARIAYGHHKLSLTSRFMLKSRENCLWTPQAYGHHELSLTSHFLLKSHEISLKDTTLWCP